MTGTHEIYRCQTGDLRWKMLHTNGQVIAKSGEGYTTRINAVHGLNSVKLNTPGTAVEDSSIRKL